MITTDDQLNSREREILLTALDLYARDLMDLRQPTGVFEVRALSERLTRPGYDVLIVDSEGQA